MFSADGLLPADPSVMPINVALSATSVSPSTQLNQFGGNELIIQGSGFSQNTDDMEVKMSDDTKCRITSTSDSELRCITDGFDAATISAASPINVSVTVNSVTDSSNQVLLSSEALQVTGISPNSVSPVLKQDLTISFDSGFPDISSSLDDYRVKVEGPDNYER